MGFRDVGAPASSAMMKRTRINDMGVYQQSRRYNYRNGKKVSNYNRVLKLVKAQTQRLLFRYANISDEADPYGSTFIRNGVLAADPTQRRYPIHCFNLSSINQTAGTTLGELAACPGFQLRGDAASGALYWVPLQARATDGTTLVSTWSRPQAPDTITNPGRKSLLDWTRVRLHMYGKKKQPSFVKISFVKFLEEECVPDFQLNTTTGISPNLGGEAYDFWSSRLKPLVSSQIASKNQVVYKKQIKVLKEMFVNIQPIDAAAETAASDSRGHIKILDVFNRWNRMHDYQLNSTSGANIQTDVQLADPDYGPVQVAGYSGYLRDKSTAIWLVIESVTPTQVTLEDPASNSETQVSYDFNIETKHSVIGNGVL